MTPLERWRLVLGKYADAPLGEQGAGASLHGAAARMDAALEYLYGREYQGRGTREDGRDGSLEPSQVTLVTWLGEVRELFPTATVEVIEQHALDRYGLTELVTDPQALERLEPNQALLRTLLAVRSHLHGEVLQMARGIVRQVLQQIRLRLEPQVRQVLSGRLDRQRHSPLAVARNFDAWGTVRRNLKHYDTQQRRLVVEKLYYFARNTRRLPWDVILCVDQSASMADSVIHAAVMAGILAGLPALRVKIVVFDTAVVDLSGYVDDPVELLMRVQLGGGTDIGQALRYCAQWVENPQRTALVLISDFYEGGSASEMLRRVKQLAEARVTLLGLAALDEQGEPRYDRHMAAQLAECGMTTAALSPQGLAQWLLKVIS